MIPKETTREDQILSALRTGRTIRQLADFLRMNPFDLADPLTELRERGLVACSNKLWYRKDIPLRPEPPRRPRMTEKQKKLLSRNRDLFE